MARLKGWKEKDIGGVSLDEFPQNFLLVPMGRFWKIASKPTPPLTFQGESNNEVVTFQSKTQWIKCHHDRDWRLKQKKLG